MASFGLMFTDFEIIANTHISKFHWFQASQIWHLASHSPESLQYLTMMTRGWNIDSPLWHHLCCWWAFWWLGATQPLGKKCWASCGVELFVSAVKCSWQVSVSLRLSTHLGLQRRKALPESIIQTLDALEIFISISKAQLIIKIIFIVNVFLAIYLLYMSIVLGGSCVCLFSCT